MNIQSFKIGNRLLFGFGIVLTLTMAFGLTSLTQFRILAELTEKMNNHPMVVSNAVRDIKIDIAKIQINIQSLTNESTEFEYRNLKKATHSLEDSIDAKFKLIEDRFLGDMSDVNKAHKTFIELRPVIDDILLMLDKKDDLKKLRKRNQDFIFLMERLSNQVQVMSDFAHNKSEEFYSNAKTTSKKIIRTTIYFLILILLMSIIIGSLISLSVTKPITDLMRHIKKLAVGDQDNVIEINTGDEIGQLSSSLNEMQVNLIEVTAHAKKIAEGDYSGEITPRSEKDDLAIALNSMTNSLSLLKEQSDYLDWVKTGQNLINDKMRGDLEIQDLASQVISSLSSYVGAKIGTLYIFNKEDKSLKLTGSFAYNLRKSTNDKIDLGDGIVGQVALEKKLISITDIPDDYIRINSSLGEAVPNNIIAFPLVFESDLIGVIELGSFNIWGKKEIELFESLSEIIGISFNSAKARNSMKNLLTQQQEQAKELVSQQEELRAANEELEEKTESLTLSEERLKSQQEELRATNEELEEKTENLEKQRDEINKKNQELEIVKDDIVLKAQALEESSRYKSEFLANMSHELRTPLNSLLILAKDLFTNKGGRLNSDDVKSAEIIYNSGTELLQLINEILDLAKIESGKMNLDIQDIPLVELAQNISNLFSTIASNKGINLNIEIGKDAPKLISSDRQKINQIIKNLVSNAIKFTKEGSVTVTLSTPNTSTKLVRDDLDIRESILIEVKDTGIGIPQDKLKTVFEAFKQADGSTSREFGGTGLGLSISKELASILGGEIQLESKDGQGSTFSLIIPRSIEDISLKIKSDSFSQMEVIREKSDKQVMLDHSEMDLFIEDDRDNLNTNDRTILIVEDDKTFATIIRNHCKDNSFKTLVTDTGEKAIKFTEKYKPDAIILDIILPGISGLQVLDYLKTSSTTRHIPVHIISGSDKSVDVYNKGVIGFLQKPVDTNKLDKTLKNISSFIDKRTKDLLIVEDDENLRVAIEKLIGNGDVKKTSVATGADALKELQKNKYDCMILDLSLPDMKGNDILKKLENMNISNKPPVIVYTGREISYEEEYELRKYTSSIIIKGVCSEERLLDETSLFLHRVIKEMPEKKQEMISKVYDEEKVFKDKKILIVDDDMRNVFAVSKILEDNGMIVDKAANGQKALNILEQRGDDIDLVLMDIMMPVLDGYETMKKIRKNNRFDTLPILALTAKAMKEDRHKCIEAGANDYMTKPVDPERLLSMMRVWLYK